MVYGIRFMLYILFLENSQEIALLEVASKYSLHTQFTQLYCLKGKDYLSIS